MAAFGSSFEQACEAHVPRRYLPTPRRTEALLEEILARLSCDPADVPLRATASLHSGAAGIAYLLYRVSCLRADGLLLAHADSWIELALAHHRTAALPHQGTAEAAAPSGASLHHGEAGVHAVRALVSWAQDDAATATRAVHRFCECGARSGELLDTVLGGTGVLIGSAVLQRAQPSEVDELRAFGDSLSLAVRKALAVGGVIAGSRTLPWLGVAHGWAGALHALLVWAEATGTEPGPEISDRLDELAALAVPSGPGSAWPRRSGSAELHQPPTAGWCHGTAGHVQLWTAAHRMYGRPIHAELAERAGIHTHAARATGANLCCGLAGQAYACLSLHRLTNESTWYERARRLAARAGASATGLVPNSLYAGDVGLALLAADLAEPGSSHMPFFELDRPGGQTRGTAQEPDLAAGTGEP